MIRANAERRVTAWLLAMCVVWGASFPVMKAGLEGFEQAVGAAAAAPAFLFWRFLAATLLFPLVFPRALGGLTPAVARAGLLLSLPFYAGFLLQTWGLRHASPTVSAFLTNLTVLATPLIGLLAFGERLSRGHAAGALITAAGVWVMTGPAGGSFGLGELLTVLSTLAWAVQIQLTHVVTRRHPPEAVTFVMFACGTCFSGLAVAATGVEGAALLRCWTAPDVAWTILFTAVVAKRIGRSAVEAGSIGRTLLASAVMAGVIWAVDQLVPAGGSRMVRALLGLALPIAAGIGTWFLALHLLRSPELLALRARVTRPARTPANRSDP